MKSMRRSRCRRATMKSKFSASTRPRPSGMSPTSPILDRFAAACDYPGVLDEAAVEKQLGLYLKALGEKRKIVRLCEGWSLSDHPSLAKYALEIAEKIYPRAA